MSRPLWKSQFGWASRLLTGRYQRSDAPHRPQVPDPGDVAAPEQIIGQLQHAIAHAQRWITYSCLMATSSRRFPLACLPGTATDEITYGSRIRRFRRRSARAQASWDEQAGVAFQPPLADLGVVPERRRVINQSRSDVLQVRGSSALAHGQRPVGYAVATGNRWRGVVGSTAPRSDRRHVSVGRFVRR